MQKTKLVAVVEDNVRVRRGLDSFLRAVGLSVLSYSDAGSFLADPRGAGVDLVLTDLHMPGLDGFALLEAMRRRGDVAAVIIMTGQPTLAARQRALDSGAAAFLEKPIDLDHLLRLTEGAPQGG